MGHTFQSTSVGTPLRAHLLEHLSEDPCWSTCEATHLLEQAKWNTPIGTPIRAHLLEHMYHYTSIGARLPEHVCRNTPIRAHLLQHIDRSTSTAARLSEHTYEHIYWSKPIVAQLSESVYWDTAIHIF
jgi:IS5 family transposase